MPEGDTIYRTATRLRQALEGKTITRFETALAHIARADDEAPLRGRTVEGVHAAGKHLIIDFSGDLHLRTHMRMHGEWHVYKTGERWWRPRRDMRVLIETSDYVAVAFDVPVAEMLSGRELARHDELRRLGPDFLGNDFDVAAAVTRARQRPDEEIGDVMLNQRVAAGAGNIYKSESLFVAGVNPFRRVGDLDDATLTRILTAARDLLQQAVGGRTRRWVYERAGDPCRKCGTPIEYRTQGRDVRGTYWCPRCQG